VQNELGSSIYKDWNAFLINFKL